MKRRTSTGPPNNPWLVFKMRELNPDWVRTVTQVVDNSGYFGLQSMRIAELTPGAARLEIEVGEKHLQPFGMVHGGVFASLVDAAGFWAVYTETDENLGLTTVEMKLNYLAPARDDRLIGLGRSLKSGRTLSLAEARVESPDGRLLAHGTVTLMTLAGLSMDGQSAAPPKFKS